jgi:hypothetical protein
MKLFDKAKQAAEQAAVKAREGVEEVQTKRDLGSAYGELGTKAFELIEAGELDRAELQPLAERIRALKAKLEEGGASAPAAAPAQPADPSQPPAMPS